MFELYSKLIDWTTTFLAWLSQKQVKAAKSRVRFCNYRIHKLRDRKEQLNGKIENGIFEYEDERIRMQHFLNTEYKEL